MKLLFLLVCLLLLTPLSVLQAEELRLAGLFSDHVVLQRDQPVPFWGWGAPGEEVTVAFAGQSKSAKADVDGRWLVRLDPMVAAAEGRELTVTSADPTRTATIRDVLVGDVWLGSGQSNMHFQMNGTAKAREEIASADHPAIRFFTVGAQFGQRPAADVKGVWKVVTPETAGSCSAVGYYFGRELHQQVGVPIGLLVSSVGGTRIETWTPVETLARIGVGAGLVDRWKDVSAEEFARIDTEYVAYQHQRDRVYPQEVRAAKQQGLPAPPVPAMPKLRCHDCPGALYNGMIAPLRPFAVRGAIWYQGEANVGNPAGYEKLQPALIEDWRRAWGDGMPFLFVQLAPHKSIHPSFREAQHRIWRTTPNTAMAVTTDVGDANNIHPTRKRPVGERLALAARALSYGEKVEYQGPEFSRLDLRGESAAIVFTHVGGGLMVKGPALQGFTVAGSDGKFFPAEARLEGQETVVVSSADVPQPVAVRYAWATVPVCNLFSAEGLPAFPFRSDAGR